MTSPNDFILAVSDLSVKVEDQTLLDNISFKLKRGTTLAIVGPNGAGKTVLFRTLLKLMPHTGVVKWSNSVKIGYVPQTLSVRDIPISVREFLSFKTGTDSKTALQSVGLDAEAVLDRSLSVLSGGQLRRVLIAWAVLDRPDVLLFDEPTTGVDLDSEEAIYEMLQKLKKQYGITLLLISHDVHIVREYSDQMLALNKCVVFFGESKAIADPSVQRLIFGEPVCVHTPA